MINELFIGAKEAEIIHRTGLTVPDPFIYLKTAGREIVFFDSREYGIIKKKIDDAGSNLAIERVEPFIEKAAHADKSIGTLQERILAAILQEYNIKKIKISRNLSFKWVELLNRSGIRFEIHDFEQERIRKREDEIENIKKVQKGLDWIFMQVRDTLKSADIRGEYLYLDNEILTSEILKHKIKRFYIEQGVTWEEGMIVSSGKQTVRPHDSGSGPLLANRSIIVDLFPRSEETKYFSDMTRTFCVGQPTAEMQKIYDAVREVQARTVDFIEVGKVAGEIYNFTLNEFNKLGFETIIGKKGFIHRVGHGLGLDIHEDPSINKHIDMIIEPGMVFSVEPGLYYPGIGGMRIEDIVVIHPDGRKENITQFEKEFLIK